MTEWVPGIRAVPYVDTLPSAWTAKAAVNRITAARTA